MNGILCDKIFCNLAYYPNMSHTGVGKELKFDKSKNLFSLDTYFKSGYNVYWGLTGKIENYKITINEDGLITELGKSTIWEKND